MSDAHARRRRNLWTLGLVLALLAAIVGYRAMNGSLTTGVLSPAEDPRAARPDTGAVTPPPQVRLEALAPDEGKEPAPERNPFRFGLRAPAPREVPASTAPAEPARTVPPATSAERLAPATAPIPLKFIGRVEAPGIGVIAALSDGTFVFHGREGDVIDGRYRIVTIGVESIVMEHVEGLGRQTIRLSG
jgi:hypothetical protein